MVTVTILAVATAMFVPANPKPLLPPAPPPIELLSPMSAVLVEDEALKALQKATQKNKTNFVRRFY